MSTDSEFEQRARLTLEESVARQDGATRSRLTQARHRALATLDGPGARSGLRAWFSGRNGLLAPVGAMAAVVVLTTVLLVRQPDPGLTAEVNSAAGSFEDMDLLADGDALAAMSEDDPEFYEWAAAQDDAGDAARGT